jgi:hypothetical protein
MLRRSLLSSLLLSAGLFGQAPTTVSPVPAKPVRVLFIGNSYTFFNNLPKLVEAIAASQKDGPRFETEVSLRGGMALKWHWEDGKAVQAIQRGGWDFVVLQDHSLLGRVPAPGTVPSVNDPADYFEYARKFDQEIKKAGARTILYATWARDGYPEQQRKLDDAFIMLAREIGAGIVPTGLAWTLAKIEAPGIKLYTPDRSHPSMAGSYLNALLFYRCLTGRNVSDPPTLITGTAWNNTRPVTLVSLPMSDSVSLNMFAQRAVSQEPLVPLR